MNEISFAFPVQYGSRGPKDKYLPAIVSLRDHICKCYGIGWPIGYKFTDEPVKKFCLSKISTYTSRFLVRPIQRIFRLPRYWVYWSNIKVFDYLFCRKVAQDESKILFTHPLLNKTISMSKASGKIIIVEAPNAEPYREYVRISRDYEKYEIKKKYIYGNKWFCDTWLRGYDMADKIIAISNISLQTYLDGGYEKQKFELIPLTGSNFICKSTTDKKVKTKAFVSTAHHSFIKGTHRLLLAWKKANIKDIPLYIVGTIGQDLQEFIEKYGPFDNVIFTGQKTDLPAFYDQLEGVGILLSLSEGAVRVVPEMMAFGFPMITTTDARCDLVENGVNGFIVDAYDEKQIIHTLQYAHENWDNVLKMGMHSKNLLRSRTVTDFSKEVAVFLARVNESCEQR